MSFFRWKTKIQNRHVGKEASEDANSTLPLTGLHAIFPVGDALRVTIGFSGVFFNTSSDDVNLVDTYGELTLNLAKYLLIGMGYRHYRFDAELDLKGGKEGTLEFTMSGIYFTIGLTPLVYFSGMMFPVQELPGGLAIAAYSTPMFHVIESFRLIVSGAAHLSVGWAWICPALLVLLALIMGRIGIRCMMRRTLG